MRPQALLPKLLLPARIGLGLVLLTRAVALDAAEVAVLKSSNPPAWQPALQALRTAAAGHSLVEHDLQGSRAETQKVLESLKGRPVIVVALGPMAAELTRQIAPELSLVFAMVADPEKVGLSKAPNTTGVAFQIPVRNQLAAFRMVNPRGVRIGIIHGPETAAQVEQAKAGARVVRASIVDRAVASDREVPKALRELIRGNNRVDALWIPPDPLLLVEQARRHILSETLRARVPVYSFSKALVSQGALASNGPDMESVGSQIAAAVERIAAGEPAEQIGIQLPKAELVINEKIAGRLRLEIPADALRAATIVE